MLLTGVYSATFIISGRETSVPLCSVLCVIRNILAKPHKFSPVNPRACSVL